MLLPLRWREPRGPLPEGVRVLHRDMISVNIATALHKAE